jgi:hypothetical protein
MNKKARKLTPFKVISSIIAGIAIIGICIYLIIQAYHNGDSSTVWQYYVLMGFAVFFTATIIRGYRIQNK